jgi:tRNA-modifying protein YgfZ
VDTSAAALLRSGHAFADLSGWRLVGLQGSEAQGWINDLLTAELSDLSRGTTRRSLLLTPTGRIRADVTVARLEDGFLLIQDPVQAEPIDRLLARYVLSSDVRLQDRTEDLALLAFPGGEASALTGVLLNPSCLGTGIDLLISPSERASARSQAAAAGLVQAGPEALERWRIERGAARFGVDLRADSLPQEAGLDPVIAYQKGCFLGQEAVAKVRNLGHPPFVVLAGRVPGPVAPGEAVLTAAGSQAGTFTSAAPAGDHQTAVIVRVRWADRDQSLTTAGGAPLAVDGPASGLG